jgi:hypothetical protein
MAGILLRNCLFLAEQPSSSLFELHPRWQILETVVGDRFHKMHMWMQPYGSGSPKATLLYSNNVAVTDGLWLPLARSASVTVQTVSRFIQNGQERVRGSAELKATQAYPPGFGKRVGELVANLWATAQQRNGVPLDLLMSLPLSDDPWEDAGLTELVSDLCRMCPGARAYVPADIVAACSSGSS